MSPFDSKLGRDTHFGFLNKATASQQLLNPMLISNEDQHTMLQAIKLELRTASSFTFSVAFISSKGIALLKQALLDFKGKGRIITSRYLDFNDPTMFRELLTLEGVEVLIHQGEGFHSKGYVFQHDVGITAVVGSSNLTDNALLVNREWNLKFSASPNGDIAFQLNDAINCQLERSIPLTAEWITEYEATRRVPERLVSQNIPLEDQSDAGRIIPNAMQEEALAALLSLTEKGEKRGVIISATGTGKTILAALATRMLKPERVLFVVHREQILDKARSEFIKVLERPVEDFGKMSGSTKELDKPFVFGTIQTLTKEATLSQISPTDFDLVIVDEVHRAGAESYLTLLDHLQPKFLLGLTATPERTDGFNIYELFDFNVPYEIRLQAALESNMLVPFHYYGVTDFTLDSKTTITDASQLSSLVSKERVHHILEALKTYGHPENVRGLIFCSKTEEAEELSRLLNKSFFNGKLLKTKALSAKDSIPHREEVVAELESGELDYILTVDIFNEGIDIPSVNQIVMIRSTQSSIVFTQQLGRGLRKAAGKDHLRVIDFIGNYANNYLIPIALFGDNSRNKNSIRRRLIENDIDGTISGVSSVNFDPIAQERIFAALKAAKLDSRAQFKQDIVQLQDRLNQIPALLDFARFNTVDPFILATYSGNYWSLLKSLKFVKKSPTESEKQFLDFLSGELLNGKRPHELLLIKELLKKPETSANEFRILLEAQATSSDEQTINSVERILSQEFYTAPNRKKFGEHPILSIQDGVYSFTPAFRNALDLSPAASNRHDAAQNFRSHVQDIIDAGLFIARHSGFWQGNLVVGERYSRRDVCRILNWERNNESTIYGYKVDSFTSTCPIFVTYHKADDVSESTRYQDELVDPNTLHWYSRGNRKITSNEIKPIAENAVDLHVFVKKDDAEGLDFFYLGQAHSENSTQSSMPGNKGVEQPVVTMDLQFDTPVEQSLFEYLSTDLSAKK
ncbi:DUF3427 domain-containing protein [Corynebacterium crudilactis]|uniref:Helicase n=1 Tax=Corynebacterium crudilactis TaxID=1652495 RepID=A0A172QSR7_9CORY|nr:DUF3427 domain-containing protein [Corynebacterium crudilactis]ANE03724.1 helicase [Corynebacterium crudilactis]